RFSRDWSSDVCSSDLARVRQVYDPILRERFDNADPRLADLEQLQAIAGGYPDRAAFLAAIALEPPQSTQDLAESSDGGEDDSLEIGRASCRARVRSWS